ncbi:protein of unknown function [Taphrina deformans PYCC 5710]|uniref:Uncharacterized protein n=1 Tax=Taphrina deformans (strain PYCC 5710 / ATCC 11124 / CBS 356.35 / IMI 108563 / JCM 9778 / NBRC 8474) TaxID=1097556 RepID=R4XBQ7_TAPDE|nr:protein of unknown function [Taphrina deformans PYCC 5710]|eukprot:CCG80768.1 protein of unknown function [Taphrina deformans PYCC 5710]
MDGDTEDGRIDALISSILERTTADGTVLDALSTMRRNQDAHERAWRDARGLILAKYETRRRLNAMMVGIGGAEGVSGEDLVRMEGVEVAAFDVKLRTAMATMYVSQAKELETVGFSVPRDGMGRVARVLDELIDEHERGVRVQTTETETGTQKTME